MEIRFAKPQDCAELLKIYGQYIDTPITFEYVLPSCEEFAARITEISAEVVHGVKVRYLELLRMKNIKATF